MAALLTPSSNAGVVDVTEFLENILLHLDLRTLLCSKRVSRHFRDVIIGSSKIRRALFLEPLAQPSDTHIATTNAHEPNGADGIVHQCLPANPPGQLFINPLLDHFLIFNAGQGITVDGPRTIFYLGQIVANPCNHSKLHCHSPAPEAENLCASWRKMLIVQPQPVHVMEKDMAGEHQVNVTDSMRMGGLYNISTDHREKWRKGDRYEALKPQGYFDIWTACRAGVDIRGTT